jgi:hypothetical protein
MAIEAPASKYRRTNLKIYIGVCILVAVIFGYDGYLSKYKWSKRYSFYQKHVIDNDGMPDSTMNFNRKSPPVFIGAAVLLGVYLLAIRNKKLIADENELIFSDKEKILCKSIQAINKTNFKSKGYFVITYKDQNGKETERKISDKKYDNLEAVLDHLVAKISEVPQ